MNNGKHHKDRRLLKMDGEAFTEDEHNLFIELYRRRFPKRPIEWKYANIHEYWEEKGFSVPPDRTDCEIWNTARLRS